MRPQPLDLTHQFKRLTPLLDLLHIRQDLRWLYDTIHAAANSSGDENLLKWCDALKSEGERVNEWIAVEVMRLVGDYSGPPDRNPAPDEDLVSLRSRLDSDNLRLCDVCGDRYVRSPATTCHVCLRQKYIDDHG